ncbi:MAG: histidine--tRNA ligase [Rhodothermales bacterium]|nr:histidine--tRNA ligase [Rhodothermales bacterium]MBO6780233.1 histidine--tRNA ligase [Rhodothermales bacterium]
MSKGFRSITGTFDILPDAYENDGSAVAGSAAWQHVEQVIREELGRFGAHEIRTPILEPTELIARGIGALTDIVSKEMFAFERGDTHYVMRPEVTAPVMRAYLQHHLGQKGGAQRLYYIGPCFRAERPQKGRYRQFHQFGGEIIGAEGPRADVEAILMMLSVYDALGVTDRTLRVNTLGDKDSRPRHKEALIAYLTPYNDDLSETSRGRLETNPLRILDTKSPKEREIVAGAPLLTEFISDDARAHYQTVLETLTDLGIAFVEDPLLVRGLDYYTHTAFELESPSLGAQSALAGGGRYDYLAQEVGSKQPVPAVGFAAGMERLFMAMAAAGAEAVEAPNPDVYLIGLGEKAQQWTTGATVRLRRAGFSAVSDLLGRSMKAQMKDANRRGARLVTILGDDELERGVIVVRNMAEGSQDEVALDDLTEAVGRNLQ